MGNWIGIGLDSIPVVDRTISSMIFQPPKKNIRALLNLEASQTCTQFFLASPQSGILIHALEYSVPQATKTVILSHGNACDVSTFHTFAAWLASSYGVNAVVYDYPGYGLSEGTPSEEGCCSALAVMVDHYKTRCRPENIVLVGQSLGTGVTVDYASRTQWEASVALISPYKSISRVVHDSPSSSFIEFLFTHNMFVSIDKVPFLRCAVKYIHGTLDTVIPISHSVDLYNKTPNKMLAPAWIEGADHDSVMRMLGDALRDVI
jgi:pimeloyl-ACP methyl ester carboxylesterase